MGLRYLNGSAGSGNGWQGWHCTLLNILGTLLNILGIITVFVRALTGETLNPNSPQNYKTNNFVSFVSSSPERTKKIYKTVSTNHMKCMVFVQAHGFIGAHCPLDSTTT